jgi:hypothetical protein
MAYIEKQKELRELEKKHEKLIYDKERYEKESFIAL